MLGTFLFNVSELLLPTLGAPMCFEEYAVVERVFL
jgi:hypothetical protein